MSFCNKLLAGLAALTLFGAPALADGIPGQKINRGPDPVEAQPQDPQQPTPPGPGCFLIEGGTAWSCPQGPGMSIGMAPTSARQTVRTTSSSYQSAPLPTYRTVTQSACTRSATTYNGQPCNTVTRRHVKTHPPVVTKRTVTHRSVPVTHTVTHRIHEPIKTVHLDMGSFTGGVGAGIDGGFYGGGGGAVIITGGRRFSGVLSHRASSVTFRSSHRGGGKKHGGKKGGGH
ncbi:MAG: hypothetical protein AAFV37_00525 [Pseudomonadota bacterium]